MEIAYPLSRPSYEELKHHTVDLSSLLVCREARIARLNSRVDELFELVEAKEAQLVGLQSRGVFPPYSRVDPTTRILRMLHGRHISVVDAAEYLTDYILFGREGILPERPPRAKPQALKLQALKPQAKKAKPKPKPQELKPKAKPLPFRGRM